MTTLSAGRAIYQKLCNDDSVFSKVTRVFPVVAEEAALPYIAYRRTGMDQALVKGLAGADTATIEVAIFAESYDESVEIAESVRASLDGVQWMVGGLQVRSCHLTDASETWSDDAFVQTLIFNVKI